MSQADVAASLVERMPHLMNSDDRLSNFTVIILGGRLYAVQGLVEHMRKRSYRQNTTGSLRRSKND